MAPTAEMNAPLCILVVDDEANIRKTLSVCLETEGHQVVAIGNCRDALSEVSRRSFDLAFVDLRLGTDRTSRRSRNASSRSTGGSTTGVSRVRRRGAESAPFVSVAGEPPGAAERDRAGIHSLHLGAEGAMVRFRVSDTGIGIPGRYLPQIFQQFFRVPDQGAGTGAGLGLAIVKEIVEAHGGTVGVESREGEGSTFLFFLRRADQPTMEGKPS